jgi:tetratricopeptide (TPR) repeat protein
LNMSAWDNPAEMLTRAQAARTQGDRDLAYQMFARASELNPQDPNAWQGRAETATNADEALVSYAYASALHPEDQPLARTLDASMAQRIGDAQKRDVPLLVAMGQELAEVGLTDRAKQFFERAAELDRNSTDALVWMAGLENDKEKQIEYLNRALATNPRDPRARGGLLAVKPPTASPPPSAPQADTAKLAADSAAALGAETTKETRERGVAANAPAQAASSLERLRQLRATAHTDEPAPRPAREMFDLPLASPRAQDNTLRYVLVALLALVVVLALAGIYLLLNQ